MKLNFRLLIIFILAGFAACATDSSVSQSSLTQTDLVGLEAQNPQLVNSSVVSGGQPTAADLALLKSKGIGTVINLRREDEDLGYDEAEAAAVLGLSYINLPVGMDNLDRQTATHLRAILNQTSAPVYVHCGSGNRVGALYAIGAHLIDGKPLEEALDVGRKAGLTGLEPRVREILINAKTAP
jgi:uncharacterized protein (TIGR01244 family)